jgi:nicotinate-nucleotide adenylyltransferase
MARDEARPANTAAGDVGSRLGELPALGEDPSRTYRLGVMGGTFDPIHNGHLVAAESALEELALDIVLFMPAGSPAFKQDKQVSSAEERYAMTLLATSDNPRFLVSRLEVDRPGVTYTAHTLEELRQHYPSNVELYFVTGADAIAEVPRWHDASSIASLAHLVGATRPGYDLAKARAALDASPYDFDVTYIEVPALAISSSHLRERVARGRSLRYLTPMAVAGFVAKHGLYATGRESASGQVGVVGAWHAQDGHVLEEGEETSDDV